MKSCEMAEITNWAKYTNGKWSKLHSSESVAGTREENRIEQTYGVVK